MADASSSVQTNDQPEIPTSSSQAPALPAKRGEIGFQDGPQEPGEVDLSSGEDAVMNAGPHPAEPSDPTGSSEQSDSHPPGVTSSDSDAATLAAPAYKRVVFGTLRSSLPNKRLGGLSNATVVRMLSILLLIGGVVTLWVVLFRVLKATATSSSDSGYSNGMRNDPTTANAMTSSFVFVHVAFTIALIILLIFFERAVYQARVDRFTYLHPDILPRYRSRGRFGSVELERVPSRGIPYAPWNRPPLPTYAAAVGMRGTGDVEDEAIAGPPPPAYGNTRGSILLLTALPTIQETSSDPGREGDAGGGVERSSSQRSWRDRIRGIVGGGSERTGADRRTSRDNDETHELPSADAVRAIALEEALAKLEEGSESTSIASSGPQKSPTTPSQGPH
ncbi:hypothetical protein FRB99_002500 [Tulasnella sp. 403]|nr:hypothetical protein FRB99_002500 [Tulasnella sp. 403]